MVRMGDKRRQRRLSRAARAARLASVSSLMTFLLADDVLTRRRMAGARLCNGRKEGQGEVIMLSQSHTTTAILLVLLINGSFEDDLKERMMVGVHFFKGEKEGKGMSGVYVTSLAKAIYFGASLVAFLLADDILRIML